ncbi:rhoptry neck protein 5 [Plasmodium gonderi]|uniref:Rhoptry neck protein 5 n=1 Tax=Plasmodium gonderi TaxID=77519 RepID=A0A1Y1JBW2_PLAGO|nr:rhoptry neck protein 5 [Plasmodium gonderi]GAW79730.1 rhoptry neck protein 5 [Plasmodium gonderi]
MLKYIFLFFYAIFAYAPLEVESKFFENLTRPKLKIGKHPIKNNLKNGKSNISLDNIEKNIMKNVDSINVMFDPKYKKFVPSKSTKAHIVGGFSQNTSDPSDVERSKYEKALRFLEKLNSEMKVYSTKIIRELGMQEHSTLRNFRRASDLLKESLVTMHALDVIKNDKTVDFSKYNLEWYAKASLQEKYKTEKYIQRIMNKIFKTTSKKKKNIEKKKIDENIEQLENDLLMQRFVSESMNVSKLLKEHEGTSPNYMSPLHSDVCGQLGSIFLSFMFEKSFKSSINKEIPYFKKYLPRLKYRIQNMVHNGTLILVEKGLDDALYTFKLKVAEIMEKKFGFVDMCSGKCIAETINANYDLEDYKNEFKPTNTAQRRADMLKMLMYYYRHNLNNIETTADFILIMLLYLNSATEHTEKGFIDVSSIGTNDKFNLLNTTIDKRKKVKKNKKKSFLKIAPFNFFREEADEKYGNESIFAIDDIIKTCLLTKKSEHFNSLYETTKDLWNNIQSIYSASYGFVVSKKLKTKSFVTSRIRNVGFIFNWFNYNKNITPHVNFLVHNFSPLISVSLQLTFFISTMIEQYESTFLSNFSAALKKIFTLGASSAHPKNYADLVNFSEMDYLLRYSKADKTQRIITQTVKMLKKKFLSLPYTPTLLAQYISLFLSLWVFENEKNITLDNPNVSRFKKLFFLSYFVHNSGPVEKAVEIIYDRCRGKTDKIVLGCIYDYGGAKEKKILGFISKKCKPTRIPIRKRNIRKILKTVMSSLADPLDILKIAVDTATRCDHFGRSSSMDKNKKSKNKINYDLFVKSELSLRYICADVTRKLVKNTIRDVSRLKNISEAQSIIDRSFNSVQYLKIRNYRDKESSISIFCPFMEENDKHIKDLERSQISTFVHKNVGLLKILKGKIINLFKKSINIREGIKTDSPISIKVGTRKFNGFLFTGGYHLNMDNFEQNTLHIGLSKSRKVYDGERFVDELEILKIDGVKKIEMKGVDEDNERFYVLENNSKVSEFEYAILYPSANIIIFDGNNYISSSALRSMGLEYERIVWAGHAVGWTAEFALATVSENPLPIFDGHAWVLLDKLSVKSILGEFLPRDVRGSLLASTVNFVILNKDGKQILKNTTPVVSLKHATFTLSGILNFVIKAEKGKGNEIIVHTRIP